MRLICRVTALTAAVLLLAAPGTRAEEPAPAPAEETAVATDAPEATPTQAPEYPNLVYKAKGEAVTQLLSLPSPGGGGGSLSATRESTSLDRTGTFTASGVV